MTLIKKPESVKVVMLCGGIGKRMFPVTTDKSLLSFNGSPLIVHQVNTARKAGLKDFIIVTNRANKSQMKSHLSKITGIKIEYVTQEKALGMADALITASQSIADSPFILISSNDLFSSSAYRSVLDANKKDSKYAAYITAMLVQDYFPGGYLNINSKAEIKNIIEKPPRGKEPSNLINIVLHLHTAPDILFKTIKGMKSNTDDIYEKALDSMAAGKHKLKAVVYKDKWQSVKYPWHILETMDFFFNSLKNNIPKTAKISEKATIDGTVYMEDGVKVLEGAVIRGPSYIGTNAIIGNNVLIRNSHIGSGTVVGFNTEVKHSYIGNNCWFHSNYIGDSVIEDDCSFGAGTITGNFRLDENNVIIYIVDSETDTGHDKLGAFIGRGTKVGINTSFMPGVRVGSNCFIGPHLCLYKDIAPDKAVYEKPGDLIIRKNYHTSSSVKRNNLKNKLGS